MWKFGSEVTETTLEAPNFYTTLEFSMTIQGDSMRIGSATTADVTLKFYSEFYNQRSGIKS